MGPLMGPVLGPVLGPVVEGEAARTNTRECCK